MKYNTCQSHNKRKLSLRPDRVEWKGVSNAVGFASRNNSGGMRVQTYGIGSGCRAKHEYTSRNSSIYVCVYTYLSARQGYVRLSSASRACGACVRYGDKKCRMCNPSGRARAPVSAPQDYGAAVAVVAAVLCIARRRGKRNGDYETTRERSFFFSFFFVFAAPESNPAVWSDDARHQIRLKRACASQLRSIFLSATGSIGDCYISTKPLEGFVS